MQRATYVHEDSPSHFCAGTGLNVGVVLRHKMFLAEKLNKYWRLLFSILLFALYKIKLFNLVHFCCLFEYVGYWLQTGVELRVGSHILDAQNFPIAVSVPQCEQRTVAVTVQLQLYFHSVRNLSVYTVCISSAC